MSLIMLMIIVSCNVLPGRKTDHLFELEYTGFPTKPYDADDNSSSEAEQFCLAVLDDDV